MLDSSGLISARFLILIAHFIICLTLLWNKEASVSACLPGKPSRQYEDILSVYLTHLITGLSLSLTLLFFEILAFISGLTMFNLNSALVSIACHGGSVIFLTGLLLRKWTCQFSWWVFAFGSLVPFVFDKIVVMEVLTEKR